VSVRRSTLEDVDGILELLTEFNDRTPMPSLRPDVRVFLEAAIQDEDSVVLVSENSGIQGVLIGRQNLNPIYDTIWLQEMAWYARDNSGVRLLLEFERVARSRGVDYVYMATLFNTDSRVHDLLTRRGYLQLERSYVLQL